MATPAISIVVPTRDRPASLARCLARLERQSGCEPFEIIVVDDGSRDAASVAEVVAKGQRARLVRIDGRGSAAARNAGVWAARGSIICFCDDDIEPPLEWATRLVQPLRDGADVVAGRMVGVRDHPFDEVGLVMGESLREGSGDTITFAGTASVACLASVIRAIPFDERFAISCEDRDWSVRLIEMGYRLVREPDAVCFHHSGETIGDFLRRYVRYGEGSYLFRQIHSSGRPAPPGFYARLIRSGFSRGLTVGVLLLVSQVAVTVGFLRAKRQARTQQM